MSEIKIEPSKNSQPGKIVVNADEWTLSNSGFAQAPEDTATFVTNIAKWFTGGRNTGKFHAYSTNFGLKESSLAQTMTQAGYTWTVGNNVKFDLPTLLTFDGIFLCGDLVDNKVLIDYVQAGGNVYVCAGTGFGGAQQEADRWNTFLNTFGLKFLGQYNNITGKFSINSSHPILTGVKALYQCNGNSVVDLDPASPTNQIVLTHASGQGLIAAFAVSEKILSLVTNSKIKLKSWKGDYLHRPDSPQGVTSCVSTPSTDVGNTWIVESIGDNKIKFKSWKGDYLHRPDSPQGVTSCVSTPSTDVGNTWIVESIGDNKIKLKSWKGDYLHRPDSPPDVTTWHTGVGNEWMLEVQPESIPTAEVKPEPAPTPTPAPQPAPTTPDESESEEVINEFVEAETTGTATGSVAITNIVYKGQVKRSQSDEYIEITNKGTTPADLSGWTVISGLNKKQSFTFPAGTTLAAGKSFRVYTNQVHPETGGFSIGSTTAIWNDKGDEGKLYDAKGNQVSTLGYGISGIPGIKAELGVSNLIVQASPSGINKQMALGGKVTFIEALKLAITNFLEDDSDPESPLALILEQPEAYDLPEGADKAAAITLLRSNLNNAKILLHTAKIGYAPENGETIDDNWIFQLDLDDSIIHWAIVDRSGVNAPYNYGFS